MAKQAFMYMALEPVCIQDDVDVKHILEAFNQSQKSHLLVVDKEGLLQGVISKNDLLKEIEALVQHSSGKTYSEMVLSSRKASDIMTKNPIVMKTSDNIELAIEYLMQQSFHCVPVVKDKKPVGIITAFDLLRGYYQEFG